MFQEARIKLTSQYLGIIMMISLFFSLVIYLGINLELTRVDRLQNRSLRYSQNLSPFLEELRRNRAERGLPPPNFETESLEPFSLAAARARILIILGSINLAILGISGVAGYFLAGRTLTPISKMVDEQKDFISNASHELRTPLTSLKTEIEVALRNEKMDLKETKALLKSNLEEVDKMHKLSNYLLSLNRYENGQANFTFSTLNLKSVAEKAIEKVRAQARAKKIRIVTRLKNAKVSGNMDSLIELVGILLDNAIKYSPPKKEVIVTTKVSGRTAILAVQDFGLGISKEDIPHIFDRFYRADTSRSKEKSDGYGLGLAIAKSIVEANHGKIIVDSKPDKGSKFEIKFS